MRATLQKTALGGLKKVKKVVKQYTNQHTNKEGEIIPDDSPDMYEDVDGEENDEHQYSDDITPETNVTEQHVVVPESNTQRTVTSSPPPQPPPQEKESDLLQLETPSDRKEDVLTKKDSFNLLFASETKPAKLDNKESVTNFTSKPAASNEGLRRDSLSQLLFGESTPKPKPSAPQTNPVTSQQVQPKEHKMATAPPKTAPSAPKQEAAFSDLFDLSSFGSGNKASSPVSKAVPPTAKPSGSPTHPKPDANTLFGDLSFTSNPKPAPTTTPPKPTPVQSTPTPSTQTSSKPISSADSILGNDPLFDFSTKPKPAPTQSPAPTQVPSKPAPAPTSAPRQTVESADSLFDFVQSKPSSSPPTTSPPSSSPLKPISDDTLFDFVSSPAKNKPAASTSQPVSSSPPPKKAATQPQKADDLFSFGSSTSPSSSPVSTSRPSAPVSQPQPSSVPAGPATPHKEAGNNFFKVGKIEEAIKCYTEGIAASARCPTQDTAACYTNRATCQHQLGNFEQVVDDCTHAIEIDPGYAKAFVRRAMALEALEKWKRAIEDYQKAKTLDPANRLASEGFRRCTNVLQQG